MRREAGSERERERERERAGVGVCGQGVTEAGVEGRQRNVAERAQQRRR